MVCAGAYLLGIRTMHTPTKSRYVLPIVFGERVVLGGLDVDFGGSFDCVRWREGAVMSEQDYEGDAGVVTKTRPKTKRPSRYRVLLLNDDYTPMEFVVEILQRIFNKNQEDAVKVMLHVHQNGVGLCGVYTYEVAETKVAQVLDAAKRNQHPLQCTMEKE